MFECPQIIKVRCTAREMAQRLAAFAALPKLCGKPQRRNSVSCPISQFQHPRQAAYNYLPETVAPAVRHPFVASEGTCTLMKPVQKGIHTFEKIVNLKKE